MTDYSKYRVPRMGLYALFVEAAQGARTYNTMNFLTGNDCDSIRMVLKLIHDPRIVFHPSIVNHNFEFHCPDNNMTMMYSAVFKLRPFIVGAGYDHLSDEKRRRLWKELLETLAPDDAEFLEFYIKKKETPESRMSASLCKKHFPEIMPSDDGSDDGVDPYILPPISKPWEGLEWESKSKDYVPPSKRVEQSPATKTEPLKTTAPEVKKGRGRPKKAVDTTTKT